MGSPMIFTRCSRCCTVAVAVAVAAVLANQLVASFIPAVPGWFATKNMLRDGYL